MDSRFFSFGLILLLELVLEGCSLAIVAAFSLRITAFSLVLPEIHRWENTRTSLLLHLVPLCTTEHTVGPGDVSLCCTVSALISSKALAEGTPGEPCWFAQEVELLIFSE